MTVRDLWQEMVRLVMVEKIDLDMPVYMEYVDLEGCKVFNTTNQCYVDSINNFIVSDL